MPPRASAGAAPLELCHAGSDVADQARDHDLPQQRCVVGSTNSGGYGSGPNWGPKTIMATASLAQPRLFGGCTSGSSVARPWCVRMKLDIHLLPKVGCAWMPKGTQVEVMTPGRHQKHYLAGALDLATGTLCHCLGARKTNALFRDLLALFRPAILPSGTPRSTSLSDNYQIHKAKAVAQWLADHPRVRLLFLPTYCPRADPIRPRVRRRA